METEIAEVLKLLGGDHGWATQVLGWVAAMRLALKPFTGKLVEFVQAGINASAADATINKTVISVLESRLYRWASFGLDWLASIKLPAAPKPQV